MTTDEPLVQLDFNVPNEQINLSKELNFLKDKDENHQHENRETADQQINGVFLSDDRQSLISLSSSSTTEDVCLVPEVGFDNINLDCSDSRESQPLLGARDQPDFATYNSFPGMCSKLIALGYEKYILSICRRLSVTISFRIPKISFTCPNWFVLLFVNRYQQTGVLMRVRGIMHGSLSINQQKNSLILSGVFFTVFVRNNIFIIVQCYAERHRKVNI